MVNATRAVTAAVLARISQIGPYFAVTTGPCPDTTPDTDTGTGTGTGRSPGTTPDTGTGRSPGNAPGTGTGHSPGSAPGAGSSSAGFRPLTELYEDPGVLEDCVRAVAVRLGTDQPRVAASTLHLGTASRLWSIALACAALTGHVPDLSPDRLWWRPAPSGPLQLWLPDVRERKETPLAAALHHTVVAQNLTPWAEAVRRVSAVSPQTLSGNAASALIGAHRVLLAREPHAPHPVVPLVREVLDRPPFSGAGTYRHAGPSEPIAFRRQNCCLYYRVPGAGTCGDCVLNTRHPQEKTA
ncbi:(2Fe-2S)-binding protein [Streptomyces sp. NPDC052042]|uniref:(2Fe-2S)-binding protein n=1 Tax=Streptomyces sp. NPDC052042 TaxID=3365683 RepID=UPI0037D67DEA